MNRKHDFNLIATYAALVLAIFANIHSCGFDAGKYSALSETVQDNSEKLAYIDNKLDPIELKLLGFLYEKQVKFDLTYLEIWRDGRVWDAPATESDRVEICNIFDDFFSDSRIIDKKRKAFEKLIYNIPEGYLRHLPISGWDSPYYLTVTEKGIDLLRTKK